ncbi:aspartate kinase [Brevibacillus fluminis]|uniref:Aspartokinase n=1 Tax=Brevibacillus fluminis TaxID=511487 RepID=A0A3M8DH79_9BACL|nr:aspartate kinase [Brevibacillus fluminis]RNB86949.1 aspartate kinase [Brevibacillus fluminis]
MALIVQKFGGTSVGTVDRIREVAKRVKESREAGHQLVVVLSAMGKTTDALVQLAKEISEHPDERDMDMLVSTGEQVSIALLAMALQQEGCEAIPLTGWQAGIVTDSVHGEARIKQIETQRIRRHLAQGKIVIIAGFQGMDEQGAITTLGRGGSDTSAVALAASLGAQLCEIYTDVAGVFTADPRLVPTAQKLSAISYQDMLDLAELGAGVLHPRSVETARSHGVHVVVRSSFSNEEGTNVGRDVPAPGITGIAHGEHVAIVTLKGEGIRSRTPVLSSLLQDAGIPVSAFVHGSSFLSFPLAKNQLQKVAALLRENREQLGYRELEEEGGFTMVSVVGVSRHSAAKVLKEIMGRMKLLHIPIRWVHQSERRLSFAIRGNKAETAIRTLHRELGLDGREELAAF